MPGYPRLPERSDGSSSPGGGGAGGARTPEEGQNAAEWRGAGAKEEKMMEGWETEVESGGKGENSSWPMERLRFWRGAGRGRGGCSPGGCPVGGRPSTNL